MATKNEDVTKIRHVSRRNDSIISEYGVIQIDENGYVSNIDELQATNVQLLSLPNFQDASQFYDPNDKSDAANKKEGVVAEVVVDEGEQLLKTRAPNDADYWLVIKQLTVDENFPKNSEGYLEMAKLNEHLKNLGWPSLTGTKRKQITDEGKIGAFKAEEDAHTGVNSINNSTGIDEKNLDPLVTSGGLNTPAGSGAVDEGMATAAVSDDNLTPGVKKTDTKPKT